MSVDRMSALMPTAWNDAWMISASVLRTRSAPPMLWIVTTNSGSQPASASSSLAFSGLYSYGSRPSVGIAHSGAIRRTWFQCTEQ